MGPGPAPSCSVAAVFQGGVNSHPRRDAGMAGMYGGLLPCRPVNMVQGHPRRTRQPLWPPTCVVPLLADFGLRRGSKRRRWGFLRPADLNFSTLFEMTLFFGEKAAFPPKKRGCAESLAIFFNGGGRAEKKRPARNFGGIQPATSGTTEYGVISMIALYHTCSYYNNSKKASAKKKNNTCHAYVGSTTKSTRGPNTNTPLLALEW